MKKRAQSLSQFFMNLSIRAKILSCMASISLLAILIATCLFYGVSYDAQIQQAQDSARLKVETASFTISDAVSALFSNIVTFVETPQVLSLLDAAQNRVSITASMLSDSQENLEKLSRTNNLIDTILLITPDGEYFSDKNIRLRSENVLPGVWADCGDELYNWLSARPSPYRTIEKNVVPLTFSIGYYKSFKTFVPHLAMAPDSVIFRLFVFFNYEKLTSLFQSDDEDRLTVTYLADRNRKPLSLLPDSRFYPVVSDEAVIRQLDSPGQHVEISDGGESYLVYSSDQLVFGMHVINITSKRELLSAYGEISSMIYLSAFITVLVAAALSVAVTRPLVQPLVKLTASVRAIGTHQPPQKVFVTRYNDEIGVLGAAINNMRETIDRQMKSIKTEERKRYNAEIRMMAQQINPHFIYNTLDCIRWEILSGNIEGSSCMVEHLAKFLRLGFSHSGDTISICEEITRVEQYLNIMRQRQNASLTLSSYVDPKLVNLQLPKMILQPLVENAIKHGFPQELFQSADQPHELYIHCVFLPDGAISLAVEDNGAGIDMEQAEKAVCLEQKDPSNEKVGLRNSYLRLRAAFGAENVSIRFASCPFYKNRVEFVIAGYQGAAQ